MLEAHALTKRFAGIEVLHRVSFCVTPGEILGYLGANGSGKSTTFKIIAGLLEPSSGYVSFRGASIHEDAASFRKQLGYVPEEPHLYTHLTPIEYLGLIGMLRGLPRPSLDRRIGDVLALFELTDASVGRMAEFSKGMRQRVLLAAALLHDPDVLVFDEPFSGLDVNTALMLRALLHALGARGKMVLLSSHRLDVVDTLCPRVVILHRGQIAAEGSPEALRRAQHSTSLEAVFAAVTGQGDYAARADAILDAVSR